MRSVVFTRTGPPPCVVTVVDRPRPHPDDGEVLVRLRARPINPSDELFIQGRYGRAPDLPAVPGFEGAGTIEETRAAGRRAGQRVAVSAIGTWQEYIAVPEEEAIPVPDWLADELACQLTINPLTALLLVRQLALRPGQWLLITAAASALSRMVLHLAHRNGIRCVCVVRNARHSDALTRAGAETVVNLASESLADRVREVTGGLGLHGALDAVGGHTGNAAVRCVRPGGQIIVYGMLDGGAINVTPHELVFADITVRGFWLPRHLDRLTANARAELTEHAVGLLGTTGFTPRIAATYRLHEVRQALEHVRRYDRHGKVLLTG
ncbi:zinc-dependent alcohol dehydrogenase family protein [Amycolatopsis rubida]|uniref:Zinc-dependent alcohol dehydrogenase family protein n=1 Tax=Amycolatopsis rubida TaxID=112413 RepID=A0ABX0BWF7_9PSEU|nr:MULTISPECIES: zinc-dependent alcohol dehydrogenase family protein [Amycolatopsis]MYW93800.1 zinc-binding dehydrogenase [Amycolatopsis rubida]NEC58790.1 zinc-dependent alcohol dehydrogenase family protein [Amycolatopsis rubida]OAP22990.1 Quinone oxidoreductase 1 [Amycolatopsis sp. M39]